jgi:hypothetical protein
VLDFQSEYAFCSMCNADTRRCTGSSQSRYPSPTTAPSSPTSSPSESAVNCVCARKRDGRFGRDRVAERTTRATRGDRPDVAAREESQALQPTFRSSRASNLLVVKVHKRFPFSPRIDPPPEMGAFVGMNSLANWDETSQLVGDRRRVRRRMGLSSGSTECG